MSDNRATEQTPVDSCTALYSFVAQEPDELTVTEGDMIDVLEFVNDDWIRGKIGGDVGMFPRAYASFGDEDTQDAIEEIVDEVTHSVNVDFEAGADDELSLTAGDMVTVLSTVGDEWLKAAADTGDKTDVFLTHDWGVDEAGRPNHDRVTAVNTALKELGYKTWFDSDKMTGDIIDKMCDGIDNTRLIIVFVTQRYLQKVRSGSDNDNCKLEFKYAMRKRGAGNLLPVIMENRMKNPSEWEGPVGMALGGVLAVRMFFDFDDTEKFKAAMVEMKREIDVRLEKFK